MRPTTSPFASRRLLRLAGALLVLSSLPASAAKPPDLQHKAAKAGTVPPSPTKLPAEAPEVSEATDIIEMDENFPRGVRCQELPPRQRIRLDFNSVPLGDLTKFISCVTATNFLLAKKVDGGAAVTMLSPTPVSISEARAAYLSALAANGLTTVRRRGYTEIVPDKEAPKRGAPILLKGGAVPRDDRVVTRLIRLEHVAVGELAPVVEKFATAAADLTVIDRSNTLILTDRGANIRRLMKLIRHLDVPAEQDRIWVREIRYAEAAAVMKVIEGVFGKADQRPAATTPRPQRGRKKAAARSAAPGDPSADPTAATVRRMIHVEDTNKLVLVASRSAYLKIDALVREIDTPQSDGGSVRLHFLEHASAQEVSEALTDMVSGASGGKRGGTGKRGKTATMAAGGATFQGEVKVRAYEPLNALIVESTPRDYRELTHLIEQMDVRTKQVYVEAIVMEISALAGKEVGVSGTGGHLLEQAGQVIPMLFGVGGMGDIGTAVTAAVEGGLGAVVRGPSKEVQVGTGADGEPVKFNLSTFGFTLKALATTANVNVVSTPHILTVNNKEALIEVGKRQPYRTTTAPSSLATLTGMGSGAESSALQSLMSTYGTSYKYIDVKLSLKIKPQINSGDEVRLEIEQGLDDIEGFVGNKDEGGAPVTANQRIQNTVVVRDGQAAVIGGLVRDLETETVGKVPILGDIPLIGALFRTTDTTQEKKNLLLVIVPHIVRHPSDLREIHRRRMFEYKELVRMMGMREKAREGRVDYRKQNGLLQDIHVTVERARATRLAAERAAKEEANRGERVGPPDTHELGHPSKQPTSIP